jgi:hypothetical protein
MDVNSASDLFKLPGAIPVIVSSIALVELFIVASWFMAFYDERTRRAAAVILRGARLPPGFGTFHGVARSFDQLRAEALVTSVRSEQAGQDGASWVTRSHVVTGESFLLVHGGGEEIEVDARDPSLSGFPETSIRSYTQAPFAAPRRELLSKLCAGDEVWVTGVLSRPADRGGGVYRSGIIRRKLGPPRRGKVMLSAESPARRWYALARAHKIGAFSAAGALVVLHAVFFRRIDMMLLSGDAGELSGHGARSASQLLFIPAVLAVVAVGILYQRQIARAQAQAT